MSAVLWAMLAAHSGLSRSKPSSMIATFTGRRKVAKCAALSSPIRLQARAFVSCACEGRGRRKQPKMHRNRSLYMQDRLTGKGLGFGAADLPNHITGGPVVPYVNGNTSLQVGQRKGRLSVAPISGANEVEQGRVL